MKQQEKMPVFVINGFLEAGKTQFITNTLQQDYFQADGTTVLILCEEGDTEYWCSDGCSREAPDRWS